jgi:hypothetical protein
MLHDRCSWKESFNKSRHISFSASCKESIKRIFAKSSELLGFGLRRTSGILNQKFREGLIASLIRHGSHWKRRVQHFFCCYVCIRYRGNVSTEPLPSNDNGTFTEQLYSNDKGTFTQPLPSNDRRMHTHSHARAHTRTHRQQRDLISLVFFQNKESRIKTVNNTTFRKLYLFSSSGEGVGDTYFLFCLSFRSVHILLKYLLYTFLLSPIYKSWSQVVIQL